MFHSVKTKTSDPSVLNELYAWPLQVMVTRYAHLANLCLAGLVVIYIGGLIVCAMNTNTETQTRA